MCGIIGAMVFNENSFSLTEEYIVRMRDTMVHRGPDGAGVWVSKDRRVGLGHRRLSIIDLSEAAFQPMSNEDGTLWLSYNGEIYNHMEIRAELEKSGKHRWKTDHSDSEVILHAFEEWGIDCLEKFRGMFAFAIWDSRARELWLVRDRIGIKPLYYSIHHGRIVFASEIKALLKDPDQKCAINEESIYHYLTFLTVPPPQTLFNGIQKLPCSTWLRIRHDGQILQNRFWDVWDHTKPMIGLSEEEISSRILSEFKTSVNLRKVSDVPMGVFLSGGIDSSANAKLFSQGEMSPVKTFCIGYQGENRSYPNELNFARLMADKIGSIHFERILSSEDLIEFLPQMIDFQDEPLGDPVCFPLYFVSELARKEGVIVCQVGEGADELFLGYSSWQRALRLQRMDDLPVPRSLKKAGLLGLRFLGRQETFSYEWLRRGSVGKPIFWGGTDAVSETQKRCLLSGRFRKQFQDLSSWEALDPIYQRFKNNAWETSPLNWMSYVDLNLRLPDLMLMRVDKMSMGVSLEARVPFLDHKFVEMAMSIPEAFKTRHGSLKYIFKKAVRNLIPDELIDRKKQGFSVPIFDWAQVQLGNRIRQELNEFCTHTDYLDEKEVNSLIDSGQSMKVWYLLNLALWWKKFIGRRV